MLTRIQKIYFGMAHNDDHGHHVCRINSEGMTFGGAGSTGMRCLGITHLLRMLAYVPSTVVVIEWSDPHSSGTWTQSAKEVLDAPLFPLLSHRLYMKYVRRYV